MRADPTLGGRWVPLRAWYPVEILRFPFRSLHQARRRLSDGASPRSTLELEAAEAQAAGRLEEWYARVSAGAERHEALASGSLVADERLRNALRALRTGASGSGASPYSLAHEGLWEALFTAPGIVDDASYAVECAAIGEVDLDRLDRQIRELEGRISWLEERFWPKVLRTVSRVVKR